LARKRVADVMRWLGLPVPSDSADREAAMAAKKYDKLTEYFLCVPGFK